MIKGGVTLGLKPQDVREMIPKDFWLMVEGFNEANSRNSNEPGANAPTRAEAEEMVRKYGN